MLDLTVERFSRNTVVILNFNFRSVRLAGLHSAVGQFDIDNYDKRLQLHVVFPASQPMQLLM